MFGKKSEKNKTLELESHRMLQKWEEEDSETLKLWNKMNKWAFDGWKETYKKVGIKFDREYYESKIYKNGKNIILDGLNTKIFEQKKDGAIFINLENEKLGEKILLRSDGTSVYMTQDIYLAKLKFDQYKLNKSYYVVGNEQEYHFNVLFSILEKLGFRNEGLKHFSYGMVTLPDGKIKSREGTTGITTDEILEKAKILTKKELEKREKLSKRELEKRVEKITLAAIKYSLLKVDAKKNILFDPKKSISFEGDTGPYILYSYARANSILNKIKKTPKNSEIKLEQKEIELIKKIESFKSIIEKSYKELNPSLIANYSYELSQVFNEFYHSCPVIGSNQEKLRIDLIIIFQQVLKNALTLLGIDTLEKM